VETLDATQRLDDMLDATETYEAKRGKGRDAAET